MNAKDIAEYLLDLTGTSLMEGDFEKLASVFHYPHPIVTFEGTNVLNSPADLRVVFDKVCSYYKSAGTKELVRYCIEAEFKSEDRIEATHVSHLLDGTRRLAEPTSCFSVVERIDGKWLITSSQYAVPAKAGLNRALAQTDPK